MAIRVCLCLCLDGVSVYEYMSSLCVSRGVNIAQKAPELQGLGGSLFLKKHLLGCPEFQLP